jgi:hypothetical protein
LLAKNIKITTNITVMLPVILCRFKTWSLLLREKNGLRVLEKCVPELRPRWEEVRGDWGKLFN